VSGFDDEIRDLGNTWSEQMKITNEKRVAMKLMGKEVCCRDCLIWEVKDKRLNPDSVRWCAGYKTYKYYDDGKHCEFFVLREEYNMGEQR
jgi:hypothetical protein